MGKPVEIPPHLNDVSGTLEWNGYLPTTPSDFGSQAEAFFKLFILEDDIVCRYGQEDKKLLLFDDFTLIDDGYVIGQASKANLKKMPTE